MNELAAVRSFVKALLREVFAELAAERDGNPAPVDRFLTMAEAAELAGVTAAHLRTMVRRGQLEAVRVGKRAIRVRASSLETFQRASKPSVMVSDLEARAAAILGERKGLTVVGGKNGR